MYLYCFHRLTEVADFVVAVVEGGDILLQLVTEFASKPGSGGQT